MHDLEQPDLLSICSFLLWTACCCQKQGHRHTTNRIHPITFCSVLWLIAIKWLFISILLLGLLQSTTHAEPSILQGRIVRVTDGDTVTLLDERHTLHKIRLAGIDAPESAMPYGNHATVYLMSLVFRKVVDAVTYKQDRYARTVATPMLGAQDVNIAMIHAGLAWQDNDPRGPWDWRKSRRALPPQSAGAIMLRELAMSASTNP